MPKKSTQGGARPGSGRKPLPPEERKPRDPQISFRVPQKIITTFNAKAKKAKLNKTEFFTKITKEAK
jgi:hypothetical protein